jgi:hypothetical protein
MLNPAYAGLNGILAIVYSAQGDNRQALNYTFKRLEMVKSLGIQRGVAVALKRRNICFSYSVILFQIKIIFII